MLHPADDFLPDIAALAEPDGPCLVEIGIVREDVAKRIIAPAFRYALGDACGIIIRAQSRGIVPMATKNIRLEAHVAKGFRTGNCRDDSGNRTRLGQGNLGPQPIQRQPLRQRRGLISRAINQKIVVSGLANEKIKQDLALRRQQRASADLTLAKSLNVACHDVLQPRPGIGA